MLVANTNAIAKEQLAENNSEAKIIATEDIKTDVQQSKDSIYEAGDVEVMPQFPGGDEAMMKFIQENTVYPENAKKNGIGGKTFVSFTIEKDGSITGIKITKSLSPECDREALRVLRLMPNWQPGIYHDEPCRTKVQIPIVFKL